MPIRLEAVRALSGAFGPEVVDALERALRDPDARVRRASIDALGVVASRPAHLALIRAVAIDGAPDVGEPAVETLVASGGQELPEELAQALIESRPEPLEERHWRALEALLAADARALGATAAVLEAALASLESTEDGAPGRAEQILEWCGHAAADRLRRELEVDPSPPLAIVRAAGATGDQGAVEPLARLLGHVDPELREAAAAALGRIRDPAGVEPLLHATRDEILEVRVAALGALDSMGVAAVAVGLAALTRPYLGAVVNGASGGAAGRRIAGLRARLRGARAGAERLYGSIATGRRGSGLRALLPAPPAVHAPRELEAGSPARALPAIAEPRHEPPEQSLVEQAQVRVAAMADEELADSHAMAVKLRPEADKQGATARSELWRALEWATVEEARSRPDFGAEDGERSLGRRASRRRGKRLRGLVEARDAAEPPR